MRLDDEDGDGGRAYLPPPSPALAAWAAHANAHRARVMRSVRVDEDAVLGGF